MTRPILIAGAGIAGLTAALSLIRRGFEVRVLEQAPELHEVGAGLQLSANGTRLLFQLGLEDTLRAQALEPDGKEVRIWNTGEARLLFDLGTESEARYGYPYLMIHRSDLHSALADAVEAAQPGALMLGRRVVGLHDDDEQATLTFADGTTISGQAVVGADGVHSVLRGLMFGKHAPDYTGCVAWRGIARADALPPSLRRSIGTNWVGPGAHAIHYPVRGGELVNFVGIVEREEWTEESWTATGSREECARDFAGWHADVQALIANLEVEPNCWGLMGRAPMDRWWHGRSCLIGDACHPTLPFLAQGANMAIEDGFVLARCMDAHRDDLAEAFSRFQALRLERTSRVVIGSAENAKRFHNPTLAEPAGARAYVEEQWRPELVEQRYDWLFAYRGEEVPV